MSTHYSCEKYILAILLFEDNSRTGLRKLQHGVTCMGSCIVIKLLSVKNELSHSVVWTQGSRFQPLPGGDGFLRALKILKHAFARRGSKVVGPMS
jgi:hypothetical protein